MPPPLSPKTAFGGKQTQYDPINNMREQLAKMRLQLPSDYSTQIGDISRRKSLLEGQAPNEGDYELLKIDQDSERLRERQRLFSQLQTPEMERSPDIPLPQRADVPLPSERLERNERAAKIAGGLLGLLTRGGAGSAVQPLINNAIQKDDREYGIARENYSLALAKADREYQEKLETRRNALDIAGRNTQVTYANAMARYGRDKELAELKSQTAGADNYRKGLGALNEKVRSNREGMAILEQDLAILKGKAEYEERSNKAYTEITTLLNQAEKLALEGRMADADITKNNAMTKLYQTQMAGEVQDQSIKKDLLPLQRRKLESDILSDETQRRVNEGNLGLQRVEMQLRKAQLDISRAEIELKKHQIGAMKVDDIIKIINNGLKGFDDAYKNATQGTLKFREDMDKKMTDIRIKINSNNINESRAGRMLQHNLNMKLNEYLKIEEIVSEKRELERARLWSRYGLNKGKSKEKEDGTVKVEMK